MQREKERKRASKKRTGKKFLCELLTSKSLWNNIRFKAIKTKQERKNRPHKIPIKLKWKSATRRNEMKKEFLLNNNRSVMFLNCRIVN